MAHSKLPHALSRRSFLGRTGAATAGLMVGEALLAQAAAASSERRHHGPNGHVLRPGTPTQVGMDPERLRDVFLRVARRAKDGRFPGAVALVARHGRVVGFEATGSKVAGKKEPMTRDALFDLESMTKVMATSTAAMILVEQGRLRLHDRVASYLPEFAAHGKGDINVRDMLRYSAGLPVDNPKVDTNNRAAIWRFMERTPLEYEPGTMVEYSDLTYRLLGRLLEKIAGMDLDTFSRRVIWKPLGMRSTMYNPPARLRARSAATGPGSLGLRPGPLRGSVQDDQDWKLGGIVGCDGVFSSAYDVAVFCQMLLNGGTYGGRRIIDRRFVKAMVRNQTPQVTAATTDQDPTTNLLFTPKGYGFEIWTHRFSPGGMLLSEGSYGKTGGAGTFMWIDPRRDLFAVLLTNHGLPIPFDQPGWNRLIDQIAPGEFYDGVVTALLR